MHELEQKWTENFQVGNVEGGPNMRLGIAYNL